MPGKQRLGLGMDSRGRTGLQLLLSKGRSYHPDSPDSSFDHFLLLEGHSEPNSCQSGNVAGLFGDMNKIACWAKY
jgi:hypothetical protein